MIRTLLLALCKLLSDVSSRFETDCCLILVIVACCLLFAVDGLLLVFYCVLCVLCCVLFRVRYLL